MGLTWNLLFLCLLTLCLVSSDALARTPKTGKKTAVPEDFDFTKRFSLDDYRTEISPIDKKRNFEVCAQNYAKAYRYIQTNPVSGEYTDQDSKNFKADKDYFNYNPDAAALIVTQGDFKVEVKKLEKDAAIPLAESITLDLKDGSISNGSFQITVSQVKAEKFKNHHCTLSLHFNRNFDFKDKLKFSLADYRDEFNVDYNTHYRDALLVPPKPPNYPLEHVTSLDLRIKEHGTKIPFSSISLTCKTNVEAHSELERMTYIRTDSNTPDPNFFGFWGLKPLAIRHVPKEICDGIANYLAVKQNQEFQDARAANVIPEKDPKEVENILLNSKFKILTPHSLFSILPRLGAGYDSKMGIVKNNSCIKGDEQTILKTESQYAFIQQTESLRLESSSSNPNGYIYPISRGVAVSDLMKALTNVTEDTGVEGLFEKEEPEFQKQCGDYYVSAIEYGAIVYSDASIHLQLFGDKKAKAKQLKPLKNVLKNYLNDNQQRKVEFYSNYGDFSEASADFDNFEMPLTEIRDLNPKLNLTWPTLTNSAAMEQLPQTFHNRTDPRSRVIIGIRLQSYKNLRDPILEAKKKRDKDKYLKEYLEKNKEKVKAMKKAHGWPDSSNDEDKKKKSSVTK